MFCHVLYIKSDLSLYTWTALWENWGLLTGRDQPGHLFGKSRFHWSSPRLPRLWSDYVDVRDEISLWWLHRSSCNTIHYSKFWTSHGFWNSVIVTLLCISKYFQRVIPNNSEGESIHLQGMQIYENKFLPPFSKGKEFAALKILSSIGHTFSEGLWVQESKHELTGVLYQKKRICS